MRAQIAALTAELAHERAMLRQLRDREATLESIFASAPFGIATAGLGWFLADANQRFLDIIGYSLAELPTLDVRDFTHPDDRAAELALAQELLAGTRSYYVLEKRYIHKDGSIVPVRVVGMIAHDADGQPARGVVIVEDISAQVQMTDALRQSEARYRSLVEDQFDIILRWRTDRVRVYVNDAYCRFFGASREELLGKPIGAYTVVADLEAANETMVRLRPDAPGLIIESRVQRADGRWFWMEWNVRGFFDREGQLVEYQAVGRDISARREAESTRDALVAVLEASPDWIAYLDNNSQIHYLNRTARQLYRLAPTPDYSALRLAELLPAWVWRTLTEEAIPAACRNETWQGELALYDAAGNEFPVLQTVLALRDSTGAVERLALIGHDLSAQKRIAAERLAFERKLLDAQKSESLGLLAGGIAHDFNNILTAIMGHTELALIDPALTSETRRSLEIVMVGVQRAADLTGAILAFAGKRQLSIEPVDVNAIVSELTDLLMASALRHCTVKLELAPNLPAIQADPAQIRQMLLNILVNAAEAIDPSGGSIHLRTRTCWMDQAALSGLPFAERLVLGRYVALDLEDTGNGMDTATLERIFDPFFTTKFTGRGMGLAAVQGILRAHYGTMRVQSRPGAGTQFAIWLPAPLHVQLPEALTKPEHIPLMSGHVLVIDDEIEVLTVAARMLTLLGFTVFKATSGPEGLALLSAGVPKLTFALIDLTMPHMRGDAVAAAIRQQYPDLPLILMSGYTADDQVSISANFAYLQKPFTLAELRTVVEAVMP